jgi:hypothetical protein
MSEDATSQPSDTTPDTTSATEDDQAQQMLALAATQTTADTTDTTDTSTPDKPEPVKADEDKLGDNGRRALASERKARREAERERNELRARLQQHEDAEKTELQKAQEAAKRYEQELTTTRVANARLMAAVAHDLPPDLIDLLGDGTDEEIDARAKLLAEKLAATAPAPAAEPAKPTATPTRPVEALKPGGRPATQEPEDPNAWLRRLAGRNP